MLTAILASVPAQAASPSTITGVVTISGTSTPITGAQIATQPASSTATTDSGGNYTLNLTAGTYTVLFSASGYNADFIAGVIAPANGTVAANAMLIQIPAKAAQDLFSRPDQSGLGTASDGHTWSNDLSKYPLGTASIVSRQAFLQCFTANTDHDTWMGIPYRDEEITADMNFQHGGRLLARVQASDSWIVLTLNSSGSTLVLWVDVNGVWTSIGSVSHAFSTGTWYHTKLDVIGSGAYGKAWAFGTGEPAWQVSGIQSGLMSTGVGGFRCAVDDVLFKNYLETPITQISGTVTEAGTGTLLTGATVTLSNGATTTTDIEGKYVFGGLAAGSYTVSATASGHIPGSVSASVSTGLSAFGANLALAVGQPTTLSASPSTVNPGGAVTATWSGINSPTAHDWIGFYVPGAPDIAPISWRYTTGATGGSVSLSIPSVGSGTYELRLFANSSLSRLATSGAITVQGASLSASPSIVGPGGSVTATWSGIINPTATDWIGFYAAGAPDSAPISWRYTTGAASGSVSIGIPAVSPGTYELRVFANSSLARLATSNAITVQGASLSASPSTVNPGGSVTATWSGIISPTATDWIGFYAAGAPNSAPISWRYTTGAASGSVAFGIPAVSPGTYELRMFANSSLARLATSSAITVQGASLSVSPSTVNPGGSVTATWSGIINPTATDWIGLYAVGAPDSSPISWRYTTGASSGSVLFNIPSSVSPGTYELRMFANSSLSRLSTSGAITVQ